MQGRGIVSTASEFESLLSSLTSTFEDVEDIELRDCHLVMVR